MLLSFSVQLGDNPGQPWPTRLALFTLVPEPRRLDLVEVAGFPDDAASLSQTLPLNSDTDALVLSCRHPNSQQGYEGATTLLITGGRVTLLESVGLLS